MHTVARDGAKGRKKRICGIDNIKRGLAPEPQPGDWAAPYIEKDVNAVNDNNVLPDVWPVSQAGPF